MYKLEFGKKQFNAVENDRIGNNEKNRISYDENGTKLDIVGNLSADELDQLLTALIHARGVLKQSKKKKPLPKLPK
jgi:hypothetical protein